jgi:FkbM family methyltransferase
MTVKYVPTETLEFDDVNFNQRWPVKVPRFIHQYHGWWDYWEIERNNSMASLLEEGMLLYDVGVFDGWLAAVYSQFVGAKNMVLIEPLPDTWGNTRITWEANGLEMPRATYMGFCADRDTEKAKVNVGAWPEGPDYSQAIKAIAFRLMHDEAHLAQTECMKIDSIAAVTGSPDAITIDVEGAEMLVIQGAMNTLVKHRPLVWIAVHLDFIEYRFQTKPLKLHKLMFDLDYECVPLGTDHEEHWLYRPRR